MKPKKYALVDRRRCVACGECAHSCQKVAISVIAGCYAEVNRDSCIGCGLCSRSCPADCITIAAQEEANQHA